MVTNELVPIKYTDDGVERFEASIPSEVEGNLNEKEKAFIQNRQIPRSRFAGDPTRNIYRLNKQAGDKLFKR